MSTDIPTASPRSFPTATLGAPSPWGNQWITVTQCSSRSCTLHSTFLEAAAQIAVIRLSHCPINDNYNNMREKKQLDTNNILTRAIYLSQTRFQADCL